VDRLLRDHHDAKNAAMDAEEILMAKPTLGCRGLRFELRPMRPFEGKSHNHDTSG
jgi:hypothetical protein